MRDRYGCDKHPTDHFVFNPASPVRCIAFNPKGFQFRRPTACRCCGRICLGRRKINLSSVFGQFVGIREVSAKGTGSSPVPRLSKQDKMLTSQCPVKANAGSTCDTNINATTGS